MIDRELMKSMTNAQRIDYLEGAIAGYQEAIELRDGQLELAKADARDLASQVDRLRTSGETLHTECDRLRAVIAELNGHILEYQRSEDAWRKDTPWWAR